jgi:hypothetical protein
VIPARAVGMRTGVQCTLLRERPFRRGPAQRLANRAYDRDRQKSARHDADRTFDPRAGWALDVVEHLAAAAAITADDVAEALLAHETKVVARSPCRDRRRTTRA